MKCPNLNALYGRRYIVTYSPEHAIEQKGRRDYVTDPWHYEIYSTDRRTHVFPWGPDRLAVSRPIPGRSGVNAQLIGLPTARLEQDGDDGVTVSFGLKDFPKVARLVRLRRGLKSSSKTTTGSIKNDH